MNVNWEGEFFMSQDDTGNAIEPNSQSSSDEEITMRPFFLGFSEFLPFLSAGCEAAVDEEKGTLRLR